MVRLGRIRPRSRGTNALPTGGVSRLELTAHEGLPWNDAHPAPESPVDLAGQEMQNAGAPTAAGSLVRKAEFDAVDADLTAHVGDTANPHAVTAAQAGAVANGGGTPEVISGLAANRPAAGVAGRIYLSTDTFRIERDTGAAWEELARAAGQIGAADLGFDPATQAELNAVDADLTAHVGDTANPHNVTIAQIGAAAAGHTHTTRILICGGGPLSIASGGVYYILPSMGSITDSVNVGDLPYCKLVMPFAGTVVDFRVHIATAPGTGFDLYLRKNNSTTGQLTASIGTINDVPVAASGALAFVAGDYLVLHFTGPAATNARIQWAIEIEVTI